MSAQVVSENTVNENVESESDKRPIQFGLTGLENMGNTCYMNTIIQCLSNCKLFREYLIHTEFLDPLTKSVVKDLRNENPNVKITEDMVKREFSQKKITWALYRVIKAIWRENNCVLTISNFKKLFGDKINFFYGFSQHDSQEALICLFDSMHEELKMTKKFKIEDVHPEVKKLMNVRDGYEKLLKEGNLSKEQVKQTLLEYENYKKENVNAVRSLRACKKWKDYNEKNRSVITDLFTGFLHSQLKCPDCNNVSDRYESFNFLLLTLKNEEGKKENQPGLEHWQRAKGGKKEIDIYDCLKNYSKEEILDDDNKWRCDGCNNKVNAEKRIFIWERPKILIILLKRFEYGRQRKISAKVNFPLEGLDISDNISELNKIEGGNYTYDLFSVSNHVGTAMGGHYYSYCKNDTGWYEFNDDDWSELNTFDTDTPEEIEENIVKPSSYLLWYKLRQ